mgnify:CR=1 FL=1
MAQAAIVTEALYEFESGTGYQDTSGNGLNFGGSTGTYTLKADDPASGSSYLSMDASTGPNAGDKTLIYGADLTGLYQDNFAIGMWVRTDNTTLGGTFFAVDAYNINLKLIQDGDQWTAAYVHTGTDSAAVAAGRIGTAFDLQVDTWTHISVIRESGDATFYVNGIAQGPSNSATIAAGAGNQTFLGGGGNAASDRDFYGDLDKVQVLSFAASDSTQDILGVMGIPEPSSAALLLGIGALATVARRRRA